MKVAILGYGVEGQAAYDYWRDDNDITICDQNTAVELPSGVASQLGEDYLVNLDEFDVIVRSPNLHPQAIIDANSPEILQKVTSNTNEFLRVCPTKNIIAVTGTKGKGTTSTLITKTLEAAGKRVYLGGNIGVAPLALLKNSIALDDFVVLELSSFQLIDLKTSPHIAVCLMVAPEHLNWHEDFEEYIAAKQQLFIHQNEDDIAIYDANNENSESIADASEGKQIPYMRTPGAEVDDDEIKIGSQSICRTDELKLLGAHNWQNVCAAVTTVWQITQNIDAIRSVLTTFAGLEHRLEFVRELDGVKYYDDSFGTTPETAIVAIQAFGEPKVVILGGSDKGASYDGLAKVIADGNVRQAILIGEQGGKIEQALRTAGFSAITLGGPTMAEIVQAARGAAQPGDAVLLSTACASFDMFKNYKDRGDQFKETVQALV